MKSIVITGSTRGIGFGLAKAFLERGCTVTISGRSQKTVEKAMTELAQHFPIEQIHGAPCEVSDFAQTQTLWESAASRFGQVDIWINNAGISHSQDLFWNIPAETFQSVVQTNLIGAMNGSKTAISGMLQQGTGSLFNMEGLGSDGRQVQGLSIYGTTKYGLRYLNNTLIHETKDTVVRVGTLSPGMVVTDLLVGHSERTPEEWEKAKRIFNILADRVETVTPWLADQVLKNTKHGATIAWLTPPKTIWRFLSAPFSRRDLFKEEI